MEIGTNIANVIAETAHAVIETLYRAEARGKVAREDIDVLHHWGVPIGSYLAPLVEGDLYEALAHGKVTLWDLRDAVRIWSGHHLAPVEDRPRATTGGHMPKSPSYDAHPGPDSEAVTLSGGYAIVKDEATARAARQIDPDVPIFIRPVED